MNFNENSECSKPETGLFEPAKVQTEVEEGSWHCVGPGPNFSEGPTVEFSIAATDEYIDLSQTKLCMKISIRKRDENGVSSQPISDPSLLLAQKHSFTQAGDDWFESFQSRWGYSPHNKGDSIPPGEENESNRGTNSSENNSNSATNSGGTVSNSRDTVSVKSDNSSFFEDRPHNIVRRQLTPTQTTGSADPVGPVNNLFHSIFKQISFTVGNTTIENSNGNYAYRAYIENVSNYGIGAKKTHLRSELFIKDTAGQLDNPDCSFYIGEIEPFVGTNTTLAQGHKGRLVLNPGALHNHGLYQRRRPFILNKDKTVELEGRLHIDLFNTDRYLLNHIPLKLTMERHKDDFCLIGDITGPSPYFIHIDKINLYVRKIKLAPSVMDRHIVQLQTQNAIYPIRRVVVKNHVIPVQMESYIIENSYTGKMPRRIVLGLVDHSAASGNIRKNPFNFQHFNLQSLKLVIAGHANPYREPIEMNYSCNNYMRAYNTLTTGIGGAVWETGNDISYEEFGNGYALYAFNVTPDQCDSDHFSIPKTGDIQFELKFAQRTDITINAVIYMEFDNLVQITNLRQVVLDYKI